MSVASEMVIVDCVTDAVKLMVASFRVIRLELIAPPTGGDINERPSRGGGPAPPEGSAIS